MLKWTKQQQQKWMLRECSEFFRFWFKVSSVCVVNMNYAENQSMSDWIINKNTLIRILHFILTVVAKSSSKKINIVDYSSARHEMLLLLLLIVLH